MEYIYLIAGLALLIAGGNYLVNSAVDIANRLGISPLIVGMTIVAFGTSAPELIVSLEAAVTGHPEISLGNVIGSNIANIGLILGLTAIIIPLAVEKVTFTRDMPFLTMVTILLFAIMNDSSITRFEGIMLVALIICYTIWCIKQTPKPEKEDINAIRYNIWVALLILAASVAALAFGSDLLINGASTIAASLGISERVIAVTIVAFGTSLPELVTSIIAATKKQADIAMGNVVGSNIFNILLVLGASAAICPIQNFSFSTFKNDILWALAFVVMLIIGSFPARRYFFKKEYPDNRFSSLGRISGAILLIGYIVYVALLF